MLFKKTLQIVLVFLSSVLLCSCSSKNNLNDDFISFYEQQLDQKVYKTSTDQNFGISTLDKEKVSGHPKVVLKVSLGSGTKYQDEVYKWLRLSINERKADLRECAELVINYAQNNNWQNDYYLYVDLAYIYGGCNIIYDYEKDEIWIPDCENTFIEMYEKFNTFYEKDLEETQKGIDFLVDNNLAYIKHNQVEYRNIFSYTVYIDNEGNFNSFGEDDSIKY